MTRACSVSWHGPMDMMTCQLPGGYVDDSGEVHRHIEVSALSGQEEELLATQHRQESASLVTSVLSRCIHRIGDIRPVSEELVRNLVVADRQYLLLKLREVTFGDRVQATIVCPRQACANRMDIDFLIQDIPVTESVDKGPMYEMQLSPEAAWGDHDGQLHTQVLFRLPNGADQELIIPVLAEDEALAAEALLSRCVLGATVNGTLREISIHQLSALARLEIEQQMEAVAPKVELTMEGACPECEHEFAAPFDLERYFFSQLRTSLNLLLREVHYLAYHYHWSEREIMEMPRQKRRRYIEVLSEEIERLNDAIR